MTRHWPWAAALRAAAFLLAASALAFAFDAAWIPVKAEIAQLLLERAWSNVQQGHIHAPPWPWADTQPVGTLTVERLGIRQILLAGSSGRNLAFGPTVEIHNLDVIVSGHRDTHFEFLQDLSPGDVIRIRSVSGVKLFAVANAEVVDSSLRDLVIDPGTSRLSLVTCYPFNAIASGGPLRFVVTALPVTAL